MTRRSFGMNGDLVALHQSHTGHIDHEWCVTEIGSVCLCLVCWTICAFVSRIGRDDCE